VESTSQKDVNFAAELFQILHKSKPNPKSVKVGLTGAPGVGKSTFIEALGRYLTKSQNLAILVQAAGTFTLHDLP